MKYRDHRGSLSDSMQTEIEVNTINDIIEHLNVFYKDFNEEVEEIAFVHVGFDDRINWDTYYVLQRLKSEKHFTVAGMSNGRIGEAKQWIR